MITLQNLSIIIDNRFIKICLYYCVASTNILASSSVFWGSRSRCSLPKSESENCSPCKVSLNYLGTFPSSVRDFEFGRSFLWHARQIVLLTISTFSFPDKSEFGALSIQKKKHSGKKNFWEKAIWVKYILIENLDLGKLPEIVAAYQCLNKSV